MISKIVSLSVGSLTYWLRNSSHARSVNGLTIGQLMVGHHGQSMLGRLISPSIVMLGSGEGNDSMYDLTFKVIS